MMLSNIHFHDIGTVYFPLMVLDKNSKLQTIERQTWTAFQRRLKLLVKPFDVREKNAF